MVEEKFVEIIGVGSYLPETIVINNALTRFMDTSDKWITEMTGIKERRFFHSDWDERYQRQLDLVECENELLTLDSKVENFEEKFNGLVTKINELKPIVERELHGDPLIDGEYAKLAYEAIKIALKDANVEPNRIAGITVACMGQDRILPTVSGYLQKMLNIDCASFDVKAACSGFPYALGIMAALIESPNCIIGNQKIKDPVYIVVAADCNSKILKLDDRNSGILFGDGSAAVVLSQTSEEPTIFSYLDGLKPKYTSDDVDTRLLWTYHDLGTGSERIALNGPKTMSVAMRAMSQTLKVLYKHFGFQKGDVLVPHQANIRIIRNVRSQYSKDEVYVNIDGYGNTLGPACAIGLDEVVKKGIVQPGGIIDLTNFGGGLTKTATRIILPKHYKSHS